jgi:RNA polymerase sigma-70 factor (family 1)
MHNYSKYSDEALFKMVIDGTQHAYTEIYKRYSNLLHSHAFFKLQDREEAKDVVQELFVNLWDKRHLIQLESNLSGYLYRTLRNKILNIIAHKKVLAAHEASLQLFLDSKPVPTDYQTRDKQLALLIESEIQSLPKKMKEIFILSRKEHLSHKEISEKLNISEKTVKNQVNNALKILRSKFGLLIFLIYYLK